MYLVRQRKVTNKKPALHKTGAGSEIRHKKKERLQMKKPLKQIITAILAAAILITGIQLNDTTTAIAAETVTAITQDMKISMKPTDTKRLILLDESGNNRSGTDYESYDYIDLFDWTSSDENVVMIDMDDVSDTDSRWCLILKPTGEGTATITGTLTRSKKPPIGSEIRITVTVKKPAAKMTAKQKKCKHTYKTTKKATCERAGIKTCTKCKWQKTIAKVDHKYVTKTIKTTDIEGYYYVIQCSHANLKTDEVDCNWTAKMKFDRFGNLMPDSEYKSMDEMMAAYGDPSKHKVPKNEIHASCMEYYEEWGEQVTTTRKASVCKYCGKEK